MKLAAKEAPLRTFQNVSRHIKKEAKHYLALMPCNFSSNELDSRLLLSLQNGFELTFDFQKHGTFQNYTHFVQNTKNRLEKLSPFR